MFNDVILKTMSRGGRDCFHREGGNISRTKIVRTLRIGIRIYHGRQVVEFKETSEHT